MPRPSKLTPDVTERVAALIRAGNTSEVAAQAVGVSESTFFAWMARGEKAGKGDSAYVAFRDAVETARAEAEATLVTRIAKAAAQGSWAAAAWLLERGAPERWAKVGERRILEEARNADNDTASGFDALDELAPRRKAS